MCDILGKFWLEIKMEPDWFDFVRYNYLGLPLAYASSQGIVAATEKTAESIQEIWQGLVVHRHLVDQGFKSYDQFKQIAFS